MTDAPRASPAPTPRRRFMRRRPPVSLVITLVTLATTVITVYLVVPRRDGELMRAAAARHRDPGTLSLERPTRDELNAWTVGALGEPVPWPVEQGGLAVVGARSLEVLRRRAALVRYRFDDGAVTVLAQRARDAPPRTHRRRDGADFVVSWRHGAFTFVAVGPAEQAERWRLLVGAP